MIYTRFGEEVVIISDHCLTKQLGTVESPKLEERLVNRECAKEKEPEEVAG